MKLSSKYAPLCFIAEIGLNHLGSFDLAKRHIDLAKESGASIAKFQTYKASNRASPGSPIHEVLRNCELSFDQFERIKSYCDSVQIEFSSTPFCLESSDFLSSLELDVVKVASFHLENKVLLRHLFENTSFTTHIVSTGMSTPQSIDSCIKLFNQYASIEMLNWSFFTVFHSILS